MILSTASLSAAGKVFKNFISNASCAGVRLLRLVGGAVVVILGVTEEIADMSDQDNDFIESLETC